MPVYCFIAAQSPQFSLFGICIFVAKVTIIFYRLWYTNHEDIEFFFENFEKEVLQSDKPVLVDFFATWCGPCKAMHPVLEELDLEEDFKVGQVDIDEYPELVSKYRIMSVPFFIVFKNGEVAGKTIGVQSKEELLALIRG